MPPPATAPPPRGSDCWHSDNSYKSRPAAYTLLYLLDGAHGTSTLLCDASRAYDTLDPELRARLHSEALLAEHDSLHNAGASGAAHARHPEHGPHVRPQQVRLTVS